jgi:hypothetical protein
VFVAICLLSDIFVHPVEKIRSTIAKLMKRGIYTYFLCVIFLVIVLL